MSDEIVIEGQIYVSSGRASQISGYTQDYIGQLCRIGAIDAKRIAGLWYLVLDSLYKHKQKADSYIPAGPKRQATREAHTLISLDGRDYISASRAAEITGYTQDYVGQLARGGKILSRQVGLKWYVDRDGILAHKKEKDALLAAVQAESVGLPEPKSQDRSEDAGESFFTYTRDDSELMPIINPTAVENSLSAEIPGRDVPIRVIHMPPILDHSGAVKGVKGRQKYRVRRPAIALFFKAFPVAALTIVIVISIGYISLKTHSVYTLDTGSAAQGNFALAASMTSAAETVSAFMERIITRELIYTRSP